MSCDYNDIHVRRTDGRLSIVHSGIIAGIMSEGSLSKFNIRRTSRSWSVGDLMLKREESLFLTDGGGEFHLKYEPKEVLGR